MSAPTLLPAILLGMVTATMLAALFHLARGRTFWDLLAIWLVALAGFWAGHGAAVIFDAPLFVVGDLQIVAGVAGCVLALISAIVSHK